MWVCLQNESENIVLSECFESGEVIDGEVLVEGLDDESRMMAIPVRHEGEIVAVMSKEWIEQTGRRPGELGAYTRRFLSISFAWCRQESSRRVHVSATHRRHRALATV